MKEHMRKPCPHTACAADINASSSNNPTKLSSASYLCNNICSFTEIVASPNIGSGQKIFYQPNSYVVTPERTHKRNRLWIKEHSCRKTMSVYKSGERNTGIWGVAILCKTQSASFLQQA